MLLLVFERHFVIEMTLSWSQALRSYRHIIPVDARLAAMCRNQTFALEVYERVDKFLASERCLRPPADTVEFSGSPLRPFRDVVNR
jgi:hypothetical protein